MVGEEKDDCIFREAGAVEFLEYGTYHVVRPANGACITSEMFADLRNVGQAGANSNLRRVIIL